MAMSKAFIRQFIGGYTEAALWSGLDDGEDFDGLSPETELEMARECEEFITSNEELFNRAVAFGQSAAALGHDLWLTRCGHGAGYWDRGLGELGDILADKASLVGERWLYVGDNKQVYQSK